MIKNLIHKLTGLPIQVKVSIIYMICSILQKGIAFIAVPIYTRLVPTDQYGIYSLYQSWDAILIILATLLMWTNLFNKGMIEYANKKDEFVSALFGLTTLLTTILAIIFIFTYKEFIQFSGLPLIVIVIMLVDFYLRPSYEYWCSRQRFEYSIKKYAITAIFITILTPIITIFLIYIFKSFERNDYGIALIIGKVLLPAIIGLVISISILKKKKKLYEKNIWIFALSFSIPLIPHLLSQIVLYQSDRIMISKMCGISEAGIYSVAYSVAAVLIIINVAIMDSIIPWEYKCLDKKEYNKIAFISNTSLILIASVNIIVAICAPEIITIMAPEEYKQAMYIIPPVAISNVFIFMFNLYANIEYFYSKTKMVALASCISAITNIILNYIFIQKFGYVAAGYTTLACYILYAFCHYCFSKKILRSQNINTRIYNNKLLWSIAGVAVIISIIIVFLYIYTAWIRWTTIPIMLFLCLLTFKRIQSTVKN